MWQRRSVYLSQGHERTLHFRNQLLFAFQEASETTTVTYLLRTDGSCGFGRWKGDTVATSDAVPTVVTLTSAVRPGFRDGAAH